MNIKLFNLFLITNHIFIGLVYILIGLIGGSIGFGLSILIRLELTLPGFNITSSLNYNSIITFHGIFMIFFMIMPILIGGFGNLLIPLLLGLNDMIFARLNALSLWIFLFSLIVVLLSLLIDGGCNSGWTFYVPLSFINYSSIDLLFFSLHLAGISSLLGSINFICTILIYNYNFYYYLIYIDLFIWSIFFTSILLLISLPVLAACITMIISDRHFNSSFFDPLKGSDLLLFQHLFWFFGQDFYLWMAVHNCKFMNYYWAICWNIPLIANNTRYDPLLKVRIVMSSGFARQLDVISKNLFSQGTISRKDFHYTFDDRILRDCTPGTYYYLAGLIDGDGYLGRNTIEITMHANEISLLYRVKSLFNGSVSLKSTNSARWRLSKGRLNVINIISDKVLTPRKHDQLLENYDIKTSNIVNPKYFDYYIAGFFDAEGYVNLDRNIIRISQKDSKVLNYIRDYLGCGKLYFDKSWNGYILDFGSRKSVLTLTEAIVNKTIVKRPSLISIHKNLK